MLPNGNITLFDNGGAPKVHPQSRGLVLSVNPATRTDSVVGEYEHPGALLAGSQGNLQALSNGDVLVGWGSEPYFSEFSAGGQLLFDAHLHGSYESYRAYRFPWTARRRVPPSIAAQASPAGGPVTVYASWNGDTQTTAWRVLAGPSPQQLQPVISAPRSGFETAITTQAAEAYVAVQALGEGGNVLATSAHDRAAEDRAGRTPAPGATSAERRAVQARRRALALGPPLVDDRQRVADDALPERGRRVQARQRLARDRHLQEAAQRLPAVGGIPTSRRSAGTVSETVSFQRFITSISPASVEVSPASAPPSCQVMRAISEVYARHCGSRAARASETWWMTESPWKMPQTVSRMLAAQLSPPRTLSSTLACG